MSLSTSLFIILLTVGNILAMWWLIRWTQKSRPNEVQQGDVTDHTWDDDLQEYNNPLPRWWLWLFYLTIFFALGYLALYPGLGSFQGLLGWSQTGQYRKEVAEAETRYGPIFAKYASQDIPTVAKDPQAIKMGERLFVTYCAACHGSDARGAPGFPNLTDRAWLYGGEPQAIKTSILQGRNGMMPPMGAALGSGAEVESVANYVMTLSGRPAPDPAKAEAGKAKFEMVCAACHGADGTGNPLLGAPDLTDANWLYGGSIKSIVKTINEGRQGRMPPHQEFLGEDKVHLLAAYVYSLSRDQ